MNLDIFIDRVGDWNPQLFRELKGRFSGNTLTFTLIISGVMQLLIYLWLADANPSNNKFYSGFQSLNWLMPIALMMGGIYSLVSDISKEEKQGTFNFIRLSPQSARSIFVGKLLGVPSLVYLAVLSLVPLHLLLALASGASLGLIFAWYTTIGVTTYLFLSLAIFYALVGGRFALLVSLVMLQPISGIISLYNHYLNSAISQEAWLSGVSSELGWFYLPVINNIWLFYGFISWTLLLASYWLWERIGRYYINLKSTDFSKEQSYLLNFNVQIWLLGFALPLLTHSSTRSGAVDTFNLLAIFSGMGSFWTFCTISLILPSKQSMQDWSQYWRKQVTRKHHHWWEQDIMQDLIWHDRSPVVLAMAANLAISVVIWGVCAILFVHDLELLGKLMLGIAIATILTLISTVIANLIELFLCQNKSSVMATLLLLLLLPILVGSWLNANPIFTNPMFINIGTNLLLFSPLFWVGVSQLSSLQIVLTLIGQLGIFVGLTKLLQRRLKNLGESASQNVIKSAAYSARSKL